MEYLLDNPWLLGILIGLVMAAAIETGRWTAARSGIHEDTNRKEQMVAIRDGLFVLVGLLLGFTLALVVPRFNERRSLVIEEAVAIESTYLRASTLAQPHAGHARQLLRQYVDARLDLDAAGSDPGRIAEASQRARQIQDQLWEGLTEVTQNDRSAIAAAYLNSLNEIIDLHAKRLAAQENRVPLPIWLLILSVSLIAVFTRGLTLAKRFWLTLVLAPITIAIVVALIADLDTTSSGLIRLDHRSMERLQVEMADHQ
jgi:hypothetical protein